MKRTFGVATIKFARSFGNNEKTVNPIITEAYTFLISRRTQRKQHQRMTCCHQPDCRRKVLQTHRQP